MIDVKHVSVTLSDKKDFTRYQFSNTTRQDLNGIG